MSTRVYELAKEMNMTNKEMLEKIHAQGIEVKSHMSVLEDKDVDKIKNNGAQSKDAAAQKSAPPAKTVIAPNGKAMPQGRPMPKNAVPQNLEKTVAEVKPEAAAVAEEKTSVEKVAVEKTTVEKTTVQKTSEKPVQVSGSQAEKTDHKQKKPVVKTAEEKPAAVKKEEKPVTADQIMGRPEPQKFKIVKTHQEVAAKEAEERAAREARQKAEAERQKAKAASRPDNRDGRDNRDNRDRRPYDGPRREGGYNNNSSQGGQNRSGGYSSSGQGGQSGQNRSGGYSNSGQGGQSGQNRSGGYNNSGQSGQNRSGGYNNNSGQSGQNRSGGYSNNGGQSSQNRSGGYNNGGPGGQNRSGAGFKPGERAPKSETAGEVLVTKPSRGKARGNEHGKKEADKSGGKFRSARPMDLTKSAPKKHKKNRDRVADQVEENAIEMEALPVGSKIVTVPITVKGLAEQIEKTTSQLIMALMKLGIMANINQNLDEETAVLLGQELGVNIVVGKVDEDVVEEGLELFEDGEDDLMSRPPIITVMGHVDHGKTSLLDAIRKTNNTATEAGGITQHIGASEVVLNGHKIVFLDTPGHEAFTAMRARGAHTTDIAILVVAADDSVKPQTIESISHAKAAGVPIIVAINKMDKPGAEPDRVKKDLADHGVLVEDWGGDTICVPVSAKSGEGIVNLLEMILLQAEVLELKANPDRLAIGTIIEARLDKAKGPVATLLVLNGTLRAGMSIVAGTCSGRIRAMTNFKGDAIHKAGPATAVEILGLTDVPEAGDVFNAVKEDKVAREIADNRKSKLREEVMARNASVTLEELFSQIEEGEVKELNLIIKADVQGSAGALTTSLEKLKTENVKVRIIHSGVGTVTESDIMLASTSGAIVIGFNVRPSTAVSVMAEREGVEIRTYRIIYEAIEDIEAALKGMLDPIYKEVVMGKIEVRETFKVPNVGIIAGAYVLEGKVQRNAQVRLVRDGIVIHEGKIGSLRRFKDDVKDVSTGYECGIGIENYNDLKEGDIIEAFKMEEVERK